MFKEKEGISEYSKILMQRNSSQSNISDPQRESISKYIKKALEAKPDQELLFNTEGKHNFVKKL